MFAWGSRGGGGRDNDLHRVSQGTTGQVRDQVGGTVRLASRGRTENQDVVTLRGDVHNLVLVSCGGVLGKNLVKKRVFVSSPVSFQVRIFCWCPITRKF